MEKETIEKILNFLKEKEGKEFPQNWNIIERLENHPDGTQYRYEGGLYLMDTNIKKLPDDLYVDGDLNLINSTIKKIPNKLHVEGDLIIWDSNITELPDYLYVGRHLMIERTPLAKKYTNEEIIEMITSKGGQINGKIRRAF